MQAGRVLTTSVVREKKGHYTTGPRWYSRLFALGSRVQRKNTTAVYFDSTIGESGVAGSKATNP